MANTVKAKVSEHHFKRRVSVGNVTLTKSESQEVEVNTTLRNMVKAGNVVVTEGDIHGGEQEKNFQGDDESGEESEADDAETEEAPRNEPDAEVEGGFEDKTVEELKDLCEERNLKKSGTKDELIERLKNSEQEG
jgi:hypothetical protein